MLIDNTGLESGDLGKFEMYVRKFRAYSFGQDMYRFIVPFPYFTLQDLSGSTYKIETYYNCILLFIQKKY